MATLTDQPETEVPSTTEETPAADVDFSNAAELFNLQSDATLSTNTPAAPNAETRTPEAVPSPEGPESKGNDTEQTPAPTPEKETKPTKEQASRDFKDLDPADIESLRKAPNHVYNHFKKRLPELYQAQKELEALKKQEIQSAQERYLLADDAYQQAPEFKQYSTAAENLETEVDYWREQLESADKGGKAFNLGTKDSDGNLSKPITYVQLKEEVSRTKALENFTKASARLEAVSRDRDGIAAQYKQQQQSYLAEARAAATKYFGWADGLQGKQAEELNVLRKQLGPLALGLAGETTARAIYTAKVLLETVQAVKAENVKLKKQMEKAGRTNPLQFGGAATSAEEGSSTDIYAGLTPEAFNR